MWDPEAVLAVSDKSQVASPVKPVKPVLELWSPTHIGRYRLSSYGLLCVEAGFGDVHVSIPLWYIVTNCWRLYKIKKNSLRGFLFFSWNVHLQLHGLIPAAKFFPLDVNICPARHKLKNCTDRKIICTYVCITLLASFFLLSSSLINMYNYIYLRNYCVVTIVHMQF